MKQQLHFLKPYLKAWFFIIAMMVIAFLIANKIINYTTPMYESTTKLRLAENTEGVANSNLYKDMDVFANSQKISAEVELIKSSTIINKALEKVDFNPVIYREGNIKKTELYTNSPVIIKNIKLQKKFLDHCFDLKVLDKANYKLITFDNKIIKGRFNTPLNFEGNSILITLNDSLLRKKSDIELIDNYEFKFYSKENQIKHIAKNIDIVSADKDVPIISINFKNSNPEKAAVFSNALATAYVEDYIETRFGAADETADFLKERISEIDNKLKGTESQILNYRNRNGITNIHQETETDLRKVAQLKIQKTNLKMNLDAVKDLERYMKKSGKDNLDLAPNFEAFNDLLSTEIVKNIKELQAKKKDLLLEYTPKDDKVVVIDNKLNDLTSYLQESVTNTRKNLESKYNNLNADISQAESVFVPVPQKERVMTVLNREFNIYEQSYNFLNQKKIEAEIAKSAQGSFHRIISHATISNSPISPNTIVIKAVAIMLGMMISLLIIFLYNSRYGSTSDVTSIETNSATPILALIPKFKNEDDSIPFFANLISQWKIKKLIHPHSIISLSGLDNLNAQDFISKHLADTMANQQQRILLVDFVKEQSAIFRLQNQNHINPAMLHIKADKLATISTEEFQAFVLAKSKEYDMTIINNMNIDAPYSLPLTAIADLKAICLDALKTPVRKLEMIDQLKENYDFENLYLIINRYGYKPKYIANAIQFVAQKLSFVKSKKSYETYTEQQVSHSN